MENKLLTLAMVAVLTACGGSSSDSSGSTETATVSTSSGTTTTSTTTSQSSNDCVVENDTISIENGQSCELTAAIRSDYNLNSDTTTVSCTSEGRVTYGGITGGSVSFNGLTLSCAS